MDTEDLLKDVRAADDRSTRENCLNLAAQVSLAKGDADGQSVLRRANAFYNFVTKGETPNV